MEGRQETSGPFQPDWEGQLVFFELSPQAELKSSQAYDPVGVGRYRIHDAESPVDARPLEVRYNVSEGDRGEDHMELAEVLPDGGAIIAGGFWPEPAFPPGHNPWYLGGIWAIKVDAEGNLEWQRVYKSLASAYLNGIASQDGGVILKGKRYTNRALTWIAKIDDEGRVVFWKNYAVDTESTEFSETPDGGVILVGDLRDDRIVKLDAQGEIAWVRTYPETIGIVYVYERQDGSLIAFGTLSRSLPYGPSSTVIAHLDPEGNIPNCEPFSASPSEIGEHFPVIPGNIGGAANARPGGSYFPSPDPWPSYDRIERPVNELCRALPPDPTATPFPMPEVAATEEGVPYAVVASDLGIPLTITRDGEWLDRQGSVPLERTYRLYSSSGQYLGDSQGTQLSGDSELTCEPILKLDPRPPRIGTLAFAGTWDPQPRISTSLAPDTPVYAEALRAYLRSSGFADPEISVSDILRIDLEGDGVDEVLINAVWQGSEELTQPGDYSLVLLRKFAQNELETISLAEDFKLSEGAETPLTRYSIFGLFDLNGDGALEIIVTGTDGQAGETIVYDEAGDDLRIVSSMNCSLGIP